MSTKIRIFFGTIMMTIAGILIAVVVMAWTNPTGNPPSGGGALYYSGGNVGIGTTTPTKPLTVGDAGILISGAGGDPALYLYKGDSSATNKYLGIGQSGQTSANRISIFQDDNGSYPWSNEWLTVLNSGNVGIGTTGPARKLHIIGDRVLLDRSLSTTPVAFEIRNEIGSGLASLGVAAAASEWITGSAVGDVAVRAMGGKLLFGTSATTGIAPSSAAMAITTTGNVGIGTTGPGYTLTVNGTAWVTSGAWSGSDVRWKKDITSLPLQGSLNKVMQLNPVSFDWRTDEFPNMHFSSGTQLGFIAQDVERIIPEVVTTDNNGYKGLSYERITPMLTAAIQEQQKQIEQLKSEIKELTKELKSR